uniref:Uncharacterized protein n=1 Tax=Mycena chlorophos TaxID=658473 RepID=A0ABQ0LML2_MYCCL|nr:predicted protein [Mycena chlorophos]
MEIGSPYALNLGDARHTPQRNTSTNLGKVLGPFRRRLSHSFTKLPAAEPEVKFEIGFRKRTNTRLLYIGRLDVQECLLLPIPSVDKTVQDILNPAGGFEKVLCADDRAKFKEAGVTAIKYLHAFKQIALWTVELDEAQLHEMVEEPIEKNIIDNDDNDLQA